jgi:sterol desaturase/sphingolipid hydroxylase (fatty acid hydroxylase superfamily)
MDFSKKNKPFKIGLKILISVLITSFVLFFFFKVSNRIKDLSLTELYNWILEITGLLNFTLESLLSAIVLVTLALLVEFIVVGKKKSSLFRLFSFRSKTLKIDLISWLIVQLGLFDFLFFLSSFGIFHYLSSILFNSIDLRLDTHIYNTTILTVFVFILSDFKNYIFHRIMHLRPFWELHAFHHSATEMNVFTATRTHFLQKMILILLDAIMYAFFQVPITVFIGVSLFYQFLQYLHHSEVNWDFGWIGKWLLISPKAHRIHHSNKEIHFNKNFGSFFVFWDKLFGTYHIDDEGFEFGLPNKKNNENTYLIEIWKGGKNFLKDTIKLIGFTKSID